MSGTDVFRFQIIPEPTTGVLMLFAAGGLVLARRLRPLSVVHPAKGKRPPA